MNTCEYWQSVSSTEASCLNGFIFLHICVDVGGFGKGWDVEVSSPSLAALHLVLIHARDSVLAELVVVEGSALSCSPEWVVFAREGVHLFLTVSECAVFVEAATVNVEFAQVSDVEPLLRVLLHRWEVIVVRGSHCGRLFVLVLIGELWLEGRCRYVQSIERVGLKRWNFTLI